MYYGDLSALVRVVKLDSFVGSLLWPPYEDQSLRPSLHIDESVEYWQSMQPCSVGKIKKHTPYMRGEFWKKGVRYKMETRIVFE